MWALAVYIANHSSIPVTNSIIAFNAEAGLAGGNSGYVISGYNNVFSNLVENYNSNVRERNGDISTKPWFAEIGFWSGTVWHEGDYHLMSSIGRWIPATKSWVADPIDSLCLDAGNPNSPFLDEPYPNGGRLNLGAYGGTAEASMSEGGVGCTEYPSMDFNHDCKVDQADLDIFMQSWLECNLYPADMCWPDGEPLEPVL